MKRPDRSMGPRALRAAALSRSIAPAGALLAAALTAGALQGCAVGRAPLSESGGGGGIAYVTPPIGPMTREQPAPPRPPDGRQLGAAQFDELWVIERRPGAPAAAGAGQEAGGSLVAHDSTGRLVAFPLARTEVKASIAGWIASVEVSQRFTNSLNARIEATYRFPLPRDAAVSDFLMTVGTRRIRGVIRERQEADRIYRAARDQGYAASLLTMDRPGYFAESVANIEPNKPIDVDLRYESPLPYADGAFEFSFPLASRPPGDPAGADRAPAAMRGGRDVALTVDLDAGIAIESIASPSHAIDVARPGPSRARVTLRQADAIANRDFILRYRVAGAAIKSGLIACRDPRDAKSGYFALMLAPPVDPAPPAGPRRAIEMIFALDASRCETPAAVEQEKAALRAGLARLTPGDTFQVVRFDPVRAVFPSPVPATPANKRSAAAEASTWQASGGHRLAGGLEAALASPPDPGRARYVAVLGDASWVDSGATLAQLRRSLGDARLFCLGAGAGPINGPLLQAMARQGRGAFLRVGAHDDPGKAMTDCFDRLARPALTDIELEGAGVRLLDLVPGRAPDLLHGQPIVLAGRFTRPADAGAASVRVTGREGGEVRRFDLPLRLDGPESGAEALPDIWANLKIADLANREIGDPNPDLLRQIRQLALEHNLVSEATAFVVVDSLTRTTGDAPTPIIISTPLSRQSAVSENKPKTAPAERH